jgi:ABC-type sugar transport system substrate-binding protein
MIRGFFMSDKSAFNRPLSAGEVLDRSLMLIAAKPFSIVALMMIAVSPDVILHLYKSIAWVARYGSAPIANIGGLPFGPAGEVYYELTLISVGAVADVVPFVVDLLTLVLTGACAVIIAHGLAHRSATIADALRRLNDRWIPVSLIAVAGVLVLHGVQLGSIEFGRALGSSALQYFASGGSIQLFMAARLVTPFLFAFAQNALWIVAAGILTSAMLETESIQDAIAREFRSSPAIGESGD